MEKLSNSNSREMQCVGKLEIASPKPVGFLCGSIPVPTHDSFLSFSSDLIPSSQTVSAPRYRMLPTETDLNSPPLPTTSVPNTRTSPPSEGVPWDDGAVTSDNLARKGEALAVSGLVDYGDEIDIIAPADILKQIFKIPYSKARLSIAVHRVGQTLVLNAGPDVEEGERFVRRNQPKCSDESLFLNFAKHSVRVEACDCPPTHSTTPEGPSKSSVLSDPLDPETTSLKPSEFQIHKFSVKEGSDGHPGYSKGKEDSLYWDSKKSKRSKERGPVKKSSHIGEKPRFPVQESDKHRKCSNDEFMRVLFWQFHNFRVLLGSDLLLFSNEKYVSVSLHLWDVSRKVAPITWLEAWLDNVMASVPELAICYHRNGVVKGYELLKTDDIFLLKGVAEDGTPAFHPYVVQQNGLSVLRFLQANCKQDPGAYWLYKSAGEEVIQLFDLSVIPQTHPSDGGDVSSSSLPSLILRGRSDSLLSLGTLLYRTAHRLSLMGPKNRFRCAQFVRKCLDLLDEPDHLVVRAFAHEQFARLILNSDEELDLASEFFPLASEVIVTDPEEESLDIVSIISESSIQESSNSDANYSQDSFSEASGSDSQDVNVSESNGFSASDLVDAKSSASLQYLRVNEGYPVYNVTSTPADVIQTIADPISSKRAAVHHVSQAIKSLRWTRQLQGIEPEFGNAETMQHPAISERFAICACGDTDCIEVCDIREWLPTCNLDHKLWKLILLLGESYLALAQAYKEDGQLVQALKVVEVACSVYGSVPQYLQDAKFISSMGKGPSWENGTNSRQEQGPLISDETQSCRSSSDQCIDSEDYTLTYLFWAKAWTLAGDVYVEFLNAHGKETSPSSTQANTAQELRMSSEVVKELMRLKKKLGQDVENCSTCSLVNCSCQSDRASSGISASSSNRDTKPSNHGKRQNKRSNLRNLSTSTNLENISLQCKGSLGRNDVSSFGKQDSDPTIGKTNREQCSSSTSWNDNHEEKSLASATIGGSKATSDNPDSDSSFDSSIDVTSEESPKSRIGGIFKYLQGPGSTDADNILSLALFCYDAGANSLGELPTGSHELLSVFKKIGWVCNELGRIRLERKNLPKAEAAFAKAIDAFREVSDHTNIILINCNLGHGRRALAEELVSKMEFFKSKSILRDAYIQALDAAKMEYGKSLKFYEAAKCELVYLNVDADDIVTDLRNEVYTQFGHTYLRLGMLLAKEDVVATVYVDEPLVDKPMGSQGLSNRRAKKGHKKSEISANDAIREALSIYESLGELRKQEAAYAYFQLACYQRDCCLKFSNLGHRSSNQSKSENGILQRVKQYLSLAERNWQKAVEFYSSTRNPIMYLTILIERAGLLSRLSDVCHSYMMLETALSCLLEGRHVSEKLHSDSSPNGTTDVCNKFWTQMQMLLKKMLASLVSAGSNKTSIGSQTPSLSKRSGDAEKLKELYKISLKSPDFHHLQSMSSLWAGSEKVSEGSG